MSTEPIASGALEIRGSAGGLLDEPFALRVRGAGPGAEVAWRARYRDDDVRVWRAAASSSEDLGTRWSPAKETTGPIAALRSLRALSIEVRAETPDGRGATRTLTRLLAAEGVRTRRWREGLAATLHVPPSGVTPCATVIADATSGANHETVAALAAPLLASRGVLVLVVAAARGGGPAEHLERARERLLAVPGAAEPIVLRALDPFDSQAPDAGIVLPALDPLDAQAPDAGIVLPPGVGARDAAPAVAAARARAWDALLHRLGALPRVSAEAS